MGKLEKMKQENPDWFKSSSTNEGGASPQNIPLKLESYEDGCFCGMNLETKENVRVYLREIEQKNATNKRKRPELEDFSDPANTNIYAKPGEAVMLFESCYPDKEAGVFNARWGNKISNNPQETKVVIAHASLHFGSKRGDNGQDTEYLLLRTVHPEHCVEVGDMDSLNKALTKYLHPNAPGANPFVYIRITDDEGDTEIVEARAKKIDRDDGMGKMSAEAQDSVQEFLNSERSEIVKMLLEDPDVRIEVFPARVLFPGTATKENMLDLHDNAKRVLKEAFYIKKPNSNETQQEDDGEQSSQADTGQSPETGFAKCCIAIRAHADGTPFFTHVRPLRPFEAAVSIKDIANPNSGV